MIKKIFAAAMGVLMASSLLAISPADAALSYQYSGTQTGKAEYFSAYITATSNDTTDPVNGKIIRNTDGKISQIVAACAATDKTGTSPTVNVILQGSTDGTNFYTVKDSGGTDITSGATSISGSGSGTTVLVGPIDTALEGRTTFPPFIRVQADLGGTTPGMTGICHVFIYRNNP